MTVFGVPRIYSYIAQKNCYDKTAVLIAFELNHYRVTKINEYLTKLFISNQV